MGSKVSAGLLMYRWRDGQLQVFLAHPGGPFFARKDNGHWTIPKGELAEGEELLACARREFEEEIGLEPVGEFATLGAIKQKGGKTVHAWAFHGDHDDTLRIECNLFQMEWPPRSGRYETFPEIDRAQFFTLQEGRKKIKDTQEPFLDRLVQLLSVKEPEG